MDGDFFSFFILCQCLFVVWCQRKPEHYMIMVVTQFFNKTGKKKVFFILYLTKLWANVCLDRVKNPVSIYNLCKRFSCAQ